MSFEYILSPLWAITTFLFIYVYIKIAIRMKVKMQPARIITYIEIILSIYLFEYIGIILTVVLILPEYILLEHAFYRLKKTIRKKI